jgi:trimeric autotransporter adhesin
MSDFDLFVATHDRFSEAVCGRGGLELAVPERKRLRFLIHSFASAAVSTVVGGAVLPSNASHAATLVFGPVADTEVHSGRPSTNFGKASRLGVDGSPIRVAYLRFNVAVPVGETVTKATLRLFTTSRSAASFFVHQVANTSWGETTTNYSNAPAIGAQVAASGGYAGNAYVPVDVTRAVTGSGPVSFAIRRTHTEGNPYNARESVSYRPQLVVETAPSSLSNASAGSLPVGSAAYPYPSNAIFVSPSGSDSANGAIGTPLRTLTRAIAVAPTGSTIVLRRGTYHEGVTIPSNKTLTVQAYPSEAVWLDGSTAVTGWVKSGAVWVKSGWTASFDSTPGFNAGRPDKSFIDSAFPMASHPDQVWVDGTRLAQVSSASQVVPGTFYVNYSADQLVIGTDPTGRVVTASHLAHGILISGANSKVRGIGVRKFATPSVDIATIRLSATGVTLENLVVSDNANVGILVARTGARLNRITSENNGMLGVSANYADGLSVVSLLSRNNNVENYKMAPVSGGLKITRTRGITVRDSVFTNNIGPGLWIDESSYNAKIANNEMINNRKHGLAYEISSLAIIADNVVTGNTSTGMKINDATNIRIYNNTIGSNGKNVDLVQDNRRASDLSIPGHDPRQDLPDPTVTWLLGNVEFMNNLVSPPTGRYGLYIRDYSGVRSAAAMNISVNGTQFNAQTSGTLMIWGITATSVAAYNTAEQFEKATGQGPGNGDAATATAPVALPSDIATLVGQPAATKHIGAFQ